jgi:hypothetical protein
MGLLVNGGGDDLDATSYRLHGCCAIPEDERAWGVGRGPVPGAELEQHAALVDGTPETLLVDVVGKREVQMEAGRLSLPACAGEVCGQCGDGRVAAVAVDRPDAAEVTCKRRRSR